MQLVSEMVASVSPDSSPEMPFAVLSAGWSSKIKNLQISFSSPAPLFHAAVALLAQWLPDEQGRLCPVLNFGMKTNTNLRGANRRHR